MSDTYKAGLDDSGAGLTFTVVDGDGNVIFDEFCAMENRMDANLPMRLDALLKKHSFDFRKIAEWSVGAGPGSFTGLRLVSAYVMGLTYDCNVKTRCVSTATMIAGCAKISEDSVTVLFDGRKNEILAFEMKKGPTGYAETGKSTVLRSINDFHKLVETGTIPVAFQRDFYAVEKYLGTEVADNVICVDRLSALPLIQFEPENFSRPLTDLLYLRPAVFVEPKQLRVVK